MSQNGQVKKTVEPEKKSQDFREKLKFYVTFSAAVIGKMIGLMVNAVSNNTPPRYLFIFFVSLPNPLHRGPRPLHPQP